MFKKKVFEVLELVVKQLIDKVLKDLQVVECYVFFVDFIEVEKKLLVFLCEVFKLIIVVDCNIVEGCKLIYVYDEFDIWVMNFVVFCNGMFNFSFSFQQFDLFSKG